MNGATRNSGARPVTDDRQLVSTWTGETTEAVESASVILLRDGDEGLEAFMLERHIDTDFAGGALVFPGGKVEDRDRGLDPELWSGLDVGTAADEMEATPDLALGWHVAAVRETFEEAGFLLATRDGYPVTGDDLGSASFEEARAALADRDATFDLEAWLEAEALVLDLGALAWWSWWITPHGLHRRYSTRFFLAAVPGDQIGVHDDVETVSSRWMTPRAALAAGEQGRFNVVYPTRHNLRALAAYGTAVGALEAARRGGIDRRPHLPEVVEEDGQVRVRHPYSGELEAP